MGVQITIRDVPESVRNTLAGRAASEGKSMQEFLRNELVRLAGKPTIEEWLREVRARKKATGTRISAEEIVNAVRADRR